VAVAVLGVVALAACGKQGVLERPAPLFGSQARAEYEAERAQEARDDAQRAAQRASEGGVEQESSGGVSSSTREILDPNQRLSPASSSPLPGTPNPLGSAPSVTGR
jgi:hypothetical protein